MLTFTQLLALPAASFPSIGTSRFWIQLVLIAAIGISAVVLTRSKADARHLAIRRIMTAIFAIIAVYFIVFPSAASRVARLVGVGRGADLLLYGLVIAFLIFVATSFKRTAALEARITKLARSIAIAQAPSPSDVYGQRHPDPVETDPREVKIIDNSSAPPSAFSEPKGENY
ncbi:MAG: DUF2304 domain-containing protein [Bowdeniella nasicola]|nr:DUF2304 domain-containing protein [Bowdeniella nasicola]